MQDPSKSLWGSNAVLLPNRDVAIRSLSVRDRRSSEWPSRQNTESKKLMRTIQVLDIKQSEAERIPGIMRKSSFLIDTDISTSFSSLLCLAYLYTRSTFSRSVRPARSTAGLTPPRSSYAGSEGSWPIAGPFSSMFSRIHSSRHEKGRLFFNKGRLLSRKGNSRK